MNLLKNDRFMFFGNKFISLKKFKKKEETASDFVEIG